MTDIVHSQRRSQLMAVIRRRDAAPELAVRRIAHRMGLRFRLHRKDLPGCPDLMFPKHRLAVFVHGCFWHQHGGCHYAHIPKSRTAYWKEKFAQNVARDRRNEDALRALAWRVLVIWKCEVGDQETVEERLRASIRHHEPGLVRDNCPVFLAQPTGSHALTRVAAQPAPPPFFVDAFAGCGGLSLGLKRAGWKGLLAIEKDPFAFKTLSTNFPPGDGPLSYDWPANIERRPWDIHELLLDHREALAGLAGNVDLLAGGPPCQGFSHAGRRSPDDPRNKLFEAYLELVDVLRPRLVLVENVRGFKSDFTVSEQGATQNFAAALERGLSAEYDMASAVIQTRNFGVPQARPRFFLVGVTKDAAYGDRIATFFEDLERQAGGFLSEHQLPRWPTARDAISDLEVAYNGTVPSVDSKGFDAIAYKAPRTPYQKAMREHHEGAPPDTRLARHRPDIRARFADIIKACHEEGRLNVTISPDTRKAHGLKKMAIRVLDPFSFAPTITSLPDDLLHYSEPRTLTVRENARLQSFPDWFSFEGNFTTGGNRRRRQVPRFTQVANAVPPLLAEQLGLALIRIARGLHATEMRVEGAADNIESRSVTVELHAKIRHPVIVDDNRSPVALD